MAVLDLPDCVHCGQMVHSLRIEDGLYKYYCTCGELVEVDNGGEGLLSDSGSR
jgi:hypothetical protein